MSLELPLLVLKRGNGLAMVSIFTLKLQTSLDFGLNFKSFLFKVLDLLYEHNILLGKFIILHLLITKVGLEPL